MMSINSHPASTPLTTYPTWPLQAATAGCTLMIFNSKVKNVCRLLTSSEALEVDHSQSGFIYRVILSTPETSPAPSFYQHRARTLCFVYNKFQGRNRGTDFQQ